MGLKTSGMHRDGGTVCSSYDQRMAGEVGYEQT